MSSTTRCRRAAAPTPAHTSCRPRASDGPPGHSANTTTAPPSASASPRNAIPRPNASIVRTVALDEPPGSKTTWLGEPMLNENAPDTGCESEETTRQATT